MKREKKLSREIREPAAVSSLVLFVVFCIFVFFPIEKKTKQSATNPSRPQVSGVSVNPQIVFCILPALHLVEREERKKDYRNKKKLTTESRKCQKRGTKISRP